MVELAGGPVDNTPLDLEGLEPELANAIRMLRRMGVQGDDRELLEQAQIEVAHRKALMERTRKDM